MSAPTFGLARGSTDKQAIERQMDALHAEGIPDERIIVEHGMSGAASHPAGLDELLLRVRDGDTVVAAELSRQDAARGRCLNSSRGSPSAACPCACCSPR